MFPMLTRPIRYVALVVSLLIVAYDLLTLLVLGMGNRRPGTDPHIGFATAALVSLLVAAWIAAESIAALVWRRWDAGPTILSPGPLLAGRLAVVSISALVPIAESIGSRDMPAGDLTIVVLIFGGLAALPLLTAVWALKFRGRGDPTNGAKVR